MLTRTSRSPFLRSLPLVLQAATAALAAVPEYRLLELPDGTRLKHAVVLPEGFRPDDTVPVLLALPPGAQDEAMVEAGLARYWGEPAARRGWIVVSPVAPRGASFHEGFERYLPALVATLLERYRVEGGKVHLAGASNGGLSAFRIARLHPELFHSLVVLPGGPPAAVDEHRLEAIASLPVRMFVGGADTPWLIRARRTEEQLRALGADVRLQVLAGEGHAPPSLEDGRVMATLDELRQELDLVGKEELPVHLSDSPGEVIPLDEDAIGRLLDSFHAAASRADEEAYFGCFAPGAVFLGTDASERWTVEDFREYAHPYFSTGRGWTYVPEQRHVRVTGGGTTGWFDELLRNEKYGLCRGTGVVVRTGEGWRLAHYALSFTIPNEAAAEVMAVVRTGAGEGERQGEGQGEGQGEEELPRRP